MPNYTSSSKLSHKSRSRRQAVGAIAVLTAFLSATAALTGTAAAAISTGAVPSTSSANLSARPATAITAVGAAAHNPGGTFHLDTQGRYVHFYGRVTDPDSAAPLTLSYRLNGITHQLGKTVPAYGGLYSSAWTLPYGTWTVQVLAVNVGPGTGNPVVGSRSVTFVDPRSRNPRGTMYVARSGNFVRVYGQTYDPDAPFFGLSVRITENGRLVGSARASSRWRVYAADMRLTPGSHLVRAIAYNVGAGNANPTIGARWITVPRPPAPSWQSRYVGNQRIAASMLASYGWGADQMAPLVALWTKESGWNPGAYNPSGAYGIPQSLPGSKMASAGPDWRTNPATQIRWGLSYIKGVYGSPAAAWGHSQATNWY